MISSRAVLGCLLLGTFVSNTGCSLLHELKPHRLQRMNRGPAPSIDPEFSWQQRGGAPRLVKNTSPTDSSKLTANSAEISVIRAQSPAPLVP